MENYLLQENEAVLYKSQVNVLDNVEKQKTNSFKKKKTQLLLTNIHVILFTKIKSIFRGESAVSEVFKVSDIKMYKSNPQIIIKHNYVEIYFLENEKHIEFSNDKEAKKFVEEATKLFCGKSKAIRIIVKAKNAVGEAGKTVGVNFKTIAGVAGMVAVNSAKNMPAGKTAGILGTIAHAVKSKTENKSDCRLLSDNEKVEYLKNYKSLLDCGAITQEEYDLKKKEILYS